jgi:uridylate kinase
MGMDHSAVAPDGRSDGVAADAALPSAPLATAAPPTDGLPRRYAPRGPAEVTGRAVPPPGQYRRVMLKLSGAVFGGGAVGIDPGVVDNIAAQISDVVASGTEVAVVVGGGNFFRGAELSQRGMARDRADYMAMLGTVMNAVALQDFLEKRGVPTRVQTAITMGQVAEPYIPRRAERHLERGRVVIFGAGVGMPYFSTDTAAAQRALEIGCEVLLMGKNGVDGVYDADPSTDPNATRFDTISYEEVLQRGLKVADSTAFSLCSDTGLPIVVFALDDGNIGRVVRGQRIGTLVSSLASDAVGAYATA